MTSAKDAHYVKLNLLAHGSGGGRSKEEAPLQLLKEDKACATEREL